MTTGSAGAMKPLVEYGILQEKSTYRAHVSAVCSQVYLFETSKVAGIVVDDKYPLVSARQPGVDVVTAMGWLVPLDDVPELSVISDAGWDGWGRYRESMSTSQKGQWAVSCVLNCINRGVLSLPLRLAVSDETTLTEQIEGMDIVVNGEASIQVKCDARSGPRPVGTGNLFIQKSERNPMKRC